MECNKDEAIRAKGMAENKLLERDTDGAKKFALKAQRLFPELDGLSQFLEIIDVYAANEKKINGVIDYYGIFGVNPFADEEILKKQYRRLALSLHPDKNKSVGADGAFQIMSQAWSVLSDKDKRSAYDLQINIRSSNQSARSNTSNEKYTTPSANTPHAHTRPSTTGAATSQSFPSTQHYQRNSASFNSRHGTHSMNVPNFQQPPATSMRFQSIHVPPHPRSTASPSGNSSLFNKLRRNSVPAFRAAYIPTQRPPFYNQNVLSRNQMASSTCSSRQETFWTLCNRCNIHYEYKNIYLNQTLLCRRCKHPFMAISMPNPPVNNRSSQPCPNPGQKQQQIPAAAPASAPKSSQESLSQPSEKHFKREHEVPTYTGRENDPPMNNSCRVPETVQTASASASYNASHGTNKERPVKRRRKDGQKNDGVREGGQGKAGTGVCIKKASVDVRVNIGAEQSRSVKELPQSNIRVLLIQKARTEIRHQLNEWEKQKLNSSLLNRQTTDNIMHALGKKSTNHPEENNQKTVFQPHESSTLTETAADANSDDYVSMSVPDANFHNFDDDRIENSFAHNQVWAAYDDDDGMPRYYAMIHRVISRSPFKMQISWLNSKSNSEFGAHDWIASGFTKTTGNFRTGKFVVSERLNSFSHPVKWEKGLRGVIHIFPTKGDVWALYRNWSSDWDETTADETIHKYDLVVVLQDYTEDTGVLVAPLVKVAGFTSVFNQHSDQRGFQIIPREEMYRFSHQVPFYVLNGLEAENAPNNCYELDPAALPLELLNVTTDAHLAERVVTDSGMLKIPGLGNESVAESCSAKTRANHRSGIENPKYVFTYSRRNKGKKVEGDCGQS